MSVNPYTVIKAHTHDDSMLILKGADIHNTIGKVKYYSGMIACSLVALAIFTRTTDLLDIFVWIWLSKVPVLLNSIDNKEFTVNCENGFDKKNDSFPGLNLALCITVVCSFVEY